MANINALTIGSTTYYLDAYNADTVDGYHASSFIKTSGGSITGSLTSNAWGSEMVSPVEQQIVLNGVSQTSDAKYAPGIGFHIGNMNWGTLKFMSDGSFRFYNNTLSAYHSVYASTFYGNLSGHATTAGYVSGTTFIV